MLGKFSVKKPYTVLVAVVLVIVLGVVSMMKMSTDLLPNISLPYVIVMTTYPGASGNSGNDCNAAGGRLHGHSQQYRKHQFGIQ